MDGMSALLAQSIPSDKRPAKVTAEMQQQIDTLQVDANNNAAACYLKLGDGERGLKFALACLKLQQGNVKAMRRAGQAYLLLHDIDNAERYLQQAKKLVPGDRAIAASLQDLARLKKEHAQKQQQLYAGMFSK
jgi:tetratricopeptide (TPR) repeat protein